MSTFCHICSAVSLTCIYLYSVTWGGVSPAPPLLLGPGSGFALLPQEATSGAGLISLVSVIFSYWSYKSSLFCELVDAFIFLMYTYFLNFIYFWLRWVFVAARGLSLVAASGGYSLLRCVGFSLRWLLLLRSTGSRRMGFSSCGTRAQ